MTSYRIEKDLIAVCPSLHTGYSAPGASSRANDIDDDDWRAAEKRPMLFQCRFKIVEMCNLVIAKTGQKLGRIRCPASTRVAWDEYPVPLLGTCSCFTCLLVGSWDQHATRNGRELAVILAVSMIQCPTVPSNSVPGT